MSHDDAFAALQARKDQERAADADRKRRRGAAKEQRRNERDRAERTPAQAVQAIRDHAGQQVSPELERSICRALGVPVPPRVPGLPIAMASVAGRISTALELRITTGAKRSVNRFGAQREVCERVADALEAHI